VDDSDARALWEAVASRYSPATGERALSARMSRTGGPVRSDALHQWVAPDAPTMVFGRGGDGLGANGRWARGGARVASEGYAWEPVLVGGIGSSRFLNWAYLDLHHDESAHLVTEIFGARHAFSVSGERGGETTLVFCPLDGTEPNIRGTLVVAPDTSLLRADWRFGTPHEDEGAGGWAEFTSLYAPMDGLPHLVPARGAYFRHGGTDPQYPDLPRTYLREVVVYHDWFVHEGAKHPCHTERGGGYNLFGETPESDFAKEFVRCVGRFIPPR